MPGGSVMTERRLPPALERRVFNRNPIEPYGFIEGEVVLDWFYGPSCPNAALHENGWKCNWSGHSTPGLVERVADRAAAIRDQKNPANPSALYVIEALRAELGEEDE